MRNVLGVMNPGLWANHRGVPPSVYGGQTRLFFTVLRPSDVQACS